MIKPILLKFIYTLFLISNFILSSEWIYQADLLETFTKNNKEIKELDGNVIIKKDDIILTTNKAIIYSNEDKLELFNDIVMISNQDTIYCDSLYYFSSSINKEYLIALGSINLVSNNRTLTSDSLYFWPQNDSVYAVGNVYLDDGESTLSSRALRYWTTSGYNGYSFVANDNVVLESSNYRAQGKIIAYTDSLQYLTIIDSTKTPYGASIISEKQKIFGENIAIQFEDSTIQNININGDPLIYNSIEAKTSLNEPLQIFQDEMYGNFIDIKYQNNSPSELKINGMANSRYNIIENLLYEGYNEVSGDTITLSFANEEINRIQVAGGARGTFYPNILASELDTIIYYEADQIDYRIKDEVNYFYNNAVINHSDTELESDYISVNWLTNQLVSYKINDNKPHVISSNNSHPMIGDTLTYNLISKKGIIRKGKTELNDAFYHGQEIINDSGDDIYSYNGMYTSCDLDHPHYYFQSNRMKIVRDKHIIARPITLYIRDLPIIPFPFAILPNKGGDRKSGWIMPSLGYSNRNGTYFHNLGYYFVINDYSEIKFLSNFYDRKGIKLNSALRYKKRYRYNGHMSSIIVRDVIADDNGIRDISNIFSSMVTQSWNFKWNHSHIIDPSQRFSLNLNYVSQNNFYQQDQVGYNTDTRLDQNLHSTINYMKKWSNSNNSISVHLSDSYNLLAEDDLQTSIGTSVYRSFKFPSISFMHGSRLLFGNGSKWYNTIYYSTSSSLKITKQYAHHLYASGISQDENGTYTYNQIDTTLYNNGVNHTMALSAAYKILKWFNISPRINIKESWIYGYNKRLLDQEGNFLDEFEFQSNSFKRRLTGDFSVSLNTKLYGMFSIKLFSLNAIRHVISPSISYSYKPDFSQSSLWGMKTNYFQIDDSGQKYDLFSGSLVSNTPDHESQSYSFRIGNDFHGKFYDGNDYIKIPLISTNSSVSYTPTNEQFNWSYISTSMYKNTNNIKLDISMQHDLYSLRDGQRVNIYASSPRLINLSSGASFNLAGKKINIVEQTSIDTAITSYDYTLEESNDNLWDASFTFRGTMSKKIDNQNTEYWDKLFWLSSRFQFYLTESWAMSYNTRFDLVSHEILSHDVIINRPLHCWLFNFRWYPGVGEGNFGSGFELLIQVRNPDLQDIRLKHNSGNMYGF